MASKEEQDTLRLLVQHVARAFYEPRFTIILDQLSRHPVIKDDDLASRMGLQPKELNKIIAVLHNDSLVRIYRQNVLKEGAQRAVGKQYYFIDYEHFCNVVKWRIAKMWHQIDSTLRSDQENKGYVCPQCKTAYSSLDADKLMDPFRGIFACEICHAEVVDNENDETVQGSQDRMKRFNHQVRFIRAGLQKTEQMVLPAFDVAAWVKSHSLDPEKSKTSQAGAGLKIAGSDPNKKEEEGVGVVIATDKDEATRKQERDAEAEVKRQQNALPAWHLKSTITGDLTALGVKEHARVEAANAMAAAAQTSNDDILKGLGVVGARPATQQQQQPAAPQVNVIPDTKPVVNKEADYYEQYYASLAASAAGSAMATPSGLSAPGSSDFDDAGFEEEDRKPNIEYLDSLNAYRKRSRSREDEGSTERFKQFKVDTPPSADVNGANGDVMGGGDAEMPADQNEEDDPIVFVNGAPMAFSKVTEEHHDLMTPDEYEKFFEVLQQRL